MYNNKVAKALYNLYTAVKLSFYVNVCVEASIFGLLNKQDLSEMSKMFSFRPRKI